MPPAPSLASSSYGPSKVPGENVMECRLHRSRGLGEWPRKFDCNGRAGRIHEKNDSCPWLTGLARAEDVNTKVTKDNLDRKSVLVQIGSLPGASRLACR